jgi:hypothetical protein
VYFVFSTCTITLIVTVLICLPHAAIQGYRPNSGETPAPGLWYSDEHLTYGDNTSVNIFFYGMHLEGVTPDRSYSADALSANRNIEPTHFDELHKYRIEWVPGPQGYLQW